MPSLTVFVVIAAAAVAVASAHARKSLKVLELTGAGAVSQPTLPRLDTAFQFAIKEGEVWAYSPADDINALALRVSLTLSLLNRVDEETMAALGPAFDLLQEEVVDSQRGFIVPVGIYEIMLAEYNNSVDVLAHEVEMVASKLRGAIATQTANITAAPHTQARFAKLGQHTGVPFINLVNEDSVSLHMRMFGEWESLQTELLQSFIQPGDVVVDVGAHIGTHAIGFALSVGSTGTVHAFEAQPGVADVLRLNAELNGLSNVVVHNAAVGGGWSGAAVAPRQVSVRVLDLSASSNANLDGDAGLANNIGGLSLLGCDSRGVELSPSFEGGALLRECQSGGTGSDDHVWVDVVSLDDVLGFGGSGGGPGGVTGGKCPSVVKIDVEGMELQVLKGAVKVLEACRPVLHVENNVDALSPQLLAFLNAHSYDLYWEVTPFTGSDNYYGNRIPTLRERRQHHWMATLSPNVLALPRTLQRDSLPLYTRELLTVLTPVDPNRPLLSQYRPVMIVENVFPQVEVKRLMADGHAGIAGDHGAIDEQSVFIALSRSTTEITGGAF